MFPQNSHENAPAAPAHTDPADLDLASALDALEITMLRAENERLTAEVAGLKERLREARWVVFPPGLEQI